MRTTGLAVLSLTLLGILLLALPATSEELAPRAIQPVQLGPTRDAADELPYAPGRIRVKFAEEAYRASILSAVEMRRGALAARAATGLPNTDAIAADVGVNKIVRQHTMPKDRDLATELGVDRWFVLHFARDVDVLAVAERLSADPNVEQALPDWRLYPALVPNDPYYPDHWGHNNTAQLLSYNSSTGRHEDGDPVGTPGFDCNAPAAWDALGGYGTSTVVIAVLDSGVDTDHPDLSLVSGYDFGDDDSNPDDNSASPGHGTACSGVACSIADNNKGSAGSAGNCKIMPIKLANSAGSMYVTTLPPAIYFAADNGADVISMSFGNYLTSDPDTDDALLYAYNHGVTIVGATGNENNTRVHYPAYNQYVIAVGAASPCGERKRSSSLSWECNPGVYTDPNGYTCDGERWWGSNYGRNSQDDPTAVDVIAPTIVPTTDIGGSGGYDPTDYYKWFNGTSAATPYTAGVCALIISKYPSYTPAQVRDRLCTTAEDVVSVESGAGWDRYAGYGIVDAEAAVGGEEPPVADFVGDPTSGDAPLTVDFTDASTGSPTSWSWDFGDAVGTSTEQNPTYTYDDPGTYTVSLTAANAYGSDTEEKIDYIVVSEGVRDYAYTETTTKGTKTGSYLDTKASDDVREGLTEILYTGHPRKRYSYLEHKWTFNVTGGTAVTFFLEAYRTSNADGDDFLFEHSTDGALYNPLVTVASATEQVYSVSLPASTSGTVYVRVTDTNRSWGANDLDAVCVDEMYIESDTEPQPPVADFVGDPTYGYVPLTVQFTDMSTGAPTSWLWSFGDGLGTSTEQNPSYTYTAVGVYTVSLTATNGEGSDTEAKPDYVTVEDQPSNTLHVSDIALSRTYDGRFYRGEALVTILDEDDVPVSGAVVSGTFNAPSTKTKSGTTNGSGAATITSDKTKSPPSDWCFTVGDVSLSGYTYHPAANLVTTACESGWQAGDFEPASADLTEPGLRFNRPNPFRETTEIVFVLPHDAHVLLEVYSVAGRRVAVLADRTMSAGPHAVRWDASEQPSGVYFCRLTAAGMVESKAMVIIR